MLWILLAGIGLLVDRHEPHQTHQPAHTMTAAFIALPLHEACHLTRPILRRFQELFVDYLHEAQVLGAFADGLIVEPGPRQP